MNNEIEKTVSNKYLSFFVDKECYALNVLNIREVLSNQDINHIPRMPDFMRGIINLRGHVVPVIDLKMKFGLGETMDSIDTSIIVTEVSTEQGDVIMGLLSDGIREVLVIENEDIEPSPDIGTEVDSSFIIILSIKRILSFDELKILATEPIPDFELKV